MRRRLQRWDVFCRVVDNFGDAGVAWRLARLLATAHARDVVLWIDRIDALARIVPGLDAALPLQRSAAVRVARLDDAAHAHPAEAVIEAFGCGLPSRYLDAMERQPPVWINLEYLSAEAWVDGMHGLPSPQPQRPLTRWFYFPGFSAASGGLMREPGLLERRQAFVAPRDDHALVISLFCYENRALPALFDAWAQGDAPVRIELADRVAPRAFAAWRGSALPAAPARVVAGAMTIDILPFVAQDAFDERLWRCDLNIVRGEDSFVRAQWAARPLVWHIYPQQGGAHRAKLEAFCDRCFAGAPVAAAAAARTFMRAFDDEDGAAAARAWPALRACLPALRDHALAWSRALASLPELSSELVEFAETRYN